MTNKQIIILSVGLTLVLILFFVLVTVLIKIKKTKKFKKEIKKTTEYIRPERMKKIEIIFQRLSIIAKVNKNFVALFEELSKDFDEIEKKFVILNQEIQETNLRSKKINKKEFDISISKIRAVNETFEGMVSKFKSKAASVLKAEEFLRNEMSFCREKLRAITTVYAKKRILLDKVAINIDELNSEIKKLTLEFDASIEKGDNNSASEIMEEVREKIVRFGIIINEGPKIQSAIFGAIPKFIKELIKLYKRAERELDVDLTHINFRKIMLDLAEKFSDIKEQYNELNIKETKKKILILIKNIKAIERMINSEIKSRNVFVTNYSDTTLVIKKTLKQFVALKKEFKELPSSGKRVSVEMNELYKILNQEAKDLDETAMSFAGLIKDKTIPFTSKVARLRILLNKNNSTISIMNKLYQLIWKDDITQKIIQNKFIQAEHALINLKARVIEKNIVLDNEQKEQLKNIELAEKELKSLIKDKSFNSRKASEKSEYLIKNLSSYYKVVGGKIEMAEMTNNLIKEFSSKRALNQKLNIEFTQAEKHYLQGNYASALNMIIESISDYNKRGKNVR